MRNRTGVTYRRPLRLRKHAMNLARRSRILIGDEYSATHAGSRVHMPRPVCPRQRPNKPDLSWLISSGRHWIQKAAALFGLIVLLGGSQALHAQPTMSEYQVKALFLLNFIKYVNWPPGTLSRNNDPIEIGVLGQDNFNDSLTNAIEGKIVDGRSIIIKHLSEDDDLSGCAILFISSSETPRLGGILGRTGTLPILTVGENESFFQDGGIINFTLREGKIHLEINLRAAQKVKLQISSKLLSVADKVNS